METKKNQNLEVKQRYEFNFETEKQFAIINGIFINSSILNCLKFIQTDGELNTEKPAFYNDGYKQYAKDIAEILAYLAYSAEYTGENDEVIEHSKSLYYILKLIKELSVPLGEVTLELNRM
jgi:hypothetical protein